MYFVLNGTEQQLFYFDNEKRSKPNSLIELSHSYLYPVHDSLFGRPNVFQLVSKDMNPESLCYLCSDTSDQAQPLSSSSSVPPPSLSSPQSHSPCGRSLSSSATAATAAVVNLSPSLALSSSTLSPSSSSPPTSSATAAAAMTSSSSSCLTHLRSLNIKIFSLNCSNAKLVTHAYCVVSLNEVKTCRTQVCSDDKLEKCWDEAFLIEFVVVVVPSIRFDLNDLEAYTEDRWYNMRFTNAPLRTPEKCSIRLSMHYNYEIIMPLSEYSTLKGMLLLDDLEFVQSLVNVCDSKNQDRQLLATSLLQLFRHENKETLLIRKFLEIDVDAAETKETLFRRDSFGTSLMSKYMNAVGSDFLKNATSGIVNKVMGNKYTTEQCNQTGLEQEKEINALLSELVDSIVASSVYVPFTLKDICHHLMIKLSQKWPNDVNVKRKAIRVSISNFEQSIGSIGTKPHQDSTNDHTNNFGPDNRRRIILFLDEVSSMPRGSSSHPPTSIDTARCLATIHQICNMHKEQFNELTTTQPYAKKVITVTDMLNKREQHINTSPSNAV
ncbi:hypothetical protein HELRODRAFT_173701 [Helobdella robusta]|uniref:Ras-GAP domain-containing protein n=1 Tax=Helobdella robusta TaxID=6412 RepID=T1F747_HELRO|nr:hypothetical protein HELRODRAFT_173701 [Helobdella robusta]ESO03404.1 hypothetical protein HELRODRAFT_173701 [Helobdella robusta]